MNHRRVIMSAETRRRRIVKCSHIGLVTAWVLVPLLLNSSASAQSVTSNLGASDTHGNSSATATKVAVPSVTAGVLHAHDVDVFSFDVTDAGVFTIQIHGFLRVMAHIEGTNGNTIVESELPIEQPLTPGTYYVSVRPENESSIIRAPFDFQVYSDSDLDADGVLDHLDAFPRDPARLSPINGISSTVANQLLVELQPEDIYPANLIDLIQTTVVFTPDGEGRYSRELRTLDWDEKLGHPVEDGSVIRFEGFDFEYGSQDWHSFHISQHGLITFGRPLTYDYWRVGNRHGSLRQIATHFVDGPTISPLFKPTQVGTPYIARSEDKIVITWMTWEPEFYISPGVRSGRPSQFQAVLYANGSIQFSYLDATFQDGIIGLFTGITKGDAVATINDVEDAEIPEHLDLLQVTLSASNSDSLIIEVKTRGAIPDPGRESIYSYRLWFDLDYPYWNENRDEEFILFIDVREGGTIQVSQGQVLQGTIPPSEGVNRIVVSTDISQWLGASGSVWAEAVEFNNASVVQSDRSDPVQVALPESAILDDLSQNDARGSSRHAEIFSYSGAPNASSIACRVIDALGDRFDFFVFHSEFRPDHQEARSPWAPFASGAEGIGIHLALAPCGDGRLKGHWELPEWVIQLDEMRDFDVSLTTLAHEILHTWTAYLSFLRPDGIREPLFGQYCRCHWRPDLHVPAAFPRVDVDTMSIMGGRYWRENIDGTFTPEAGYYRSGLSWLDLYAMGLAEASEVPDMFLLRNLVSVDSNDQSINRLDLAAYRGSAYRGRKEIVSIEQIIAAEGTREPNIALSQKEFNVGFVYLLAPDRDPSGDLLALHGRFFERALEYWSHITGGRSSIASNH